MKPMTEGEIIALAAAMSGSGGSSGEGDMKKSVYDNDSSVSDAGGIKAYVTSQIPDVETLTAAQVTTLKGLI